MNQKKISTMEVLEVQKRIKQIQKEGNLEGDDRIRLGGMMVAMQMQGITYNEADAVLKEYEYLT